MIEINDYLFNKKNINYIRFFVSDSDDYVWRKTYHLLIYFVGKEDYVEIKTYDEQMFIKWKEELQ